MRSVLAEEALSVPESGAAVHPPFGEGRWRSVQCSFSITPFSILTHSSSKQLSTRQKLHLWRLKKSESPGEMGKVGHSEATHQRVTPEKLMAPLRVNSDAADTNTSVLAIRYLSCSYTAKTAALI